MSTTSIAKKAIPNNQICQGDIYKDVKYSYISEDKDDSIEIVEYTFPLAIVISQACDVDFMSRIIETKSGKANKFMPSILMCPIYNREDAKKMSYLDAAFKELDIIKEGDEKTPLFTSKEGEIIDRDWHYRFHALTVIDEAKRILIENAIIDFKHYFTVPASYLYTNRANRLYHMESLFAEQVTLKYATYLSRVAIP
jgi:hypothetical protein